MMNKIIPENWFLIDLEKVIIITKGKKPRVLKDEEFKNSTPYLDIMAIEEGKVRRWADRKSSKLTTRNELIMVWDGSRCGWVGQSKDGALGSTLASILPIKVDVRYLYYFLKKNYSYINSNSRGVGIPHVDPNILLKIKFPLPPLSEQKNIAGKLNEIIPKLDSIKKSLYRFSDTLSELKKLIINSAVKGTLTNEDAKFKYVKVENLITDLRYGTSKKSTYKADGPPILRIPNISDFQLDKTDLKYSSLTESEIDKYKLEDGDILVIRSNGSVNLLGRTSIVSEDFVGMCYAGYLIRLRLDRSLANPKYINYIFHSDFLRNQIESNARSTSGINNINSSEIKNLKVPITSIENQKKIISIIEKAFERINNLKEKFTIINNSFESIYELIYEKAFSGNLLSKGGLDSAQNLINLINNERQLILEQKKLKKRIRYSNTFKEANFMEILEILSSADGKLGTKQVWKSSKYKDDIDRFYAALKKEVDANRVKESDDKKYLVLV